MKTEVGQALYRMRQQTVEPVFEMIKEVIGFRRFRLRGRETIGSRHRNKILSPTGC